MPKSVVPSYYGQLPDGDLRFNDSINWFKQGMEIRNPMTEEGIVEDWEKATKIWEKSFTSRLLQPKPQKPSENKLNDPPQDGEDEVMEIDNPDEDEGGILVEHPLLMTEPGANPTKNREKTCELAMESWGAPAFFMVKSGVSAAFASGKASALVVDVGAASTNITAVHDGLILKKSVQRTPLAGNFVTNQLRTFLSQQNPPVKVTPHFMIQNKQPVEPGAPANATLRNTDGITNSFIRLQEDRVLQNMKEYAVQIYPQGKLSAASPDILSQFSNQPRPFEFPDGYNLALGTERFKVVEGLFDPVAAYTDSGNRISDGAKSIVACIKASLEQVDVDVRMHLLQNVVVTGGSSLLVGFTERLNNELTAMYPSARVRLSAAGNVYERSYGPWLGGSILASLGTFHQMWISKKEYDEFGANIVEKRCK